MELVQSLEALAEQNLSGLPFLAAYGLTWLICGTVWRRAGERTAAFVTLFQGMVALPIALGLSFLIGATGQERPVSESITQLSVLVGVSQLLGLPFLIYLVIKQYYRLVPLAFAGITSMHFVLYSWLYQTPAYIVMAVLISIGTTVIMLLVPQQAQQFLGPSRVSFLTGCLLLSAALYLLIVHVIAW